MRLISILHSLFGQTFIATVPDKPNLILFPDIGLGRVYKGRVKWDDHDKKEDKGLVRGWGNRISVGISLYLSKSIFNHINTLL